MQNCRYNETSFLGTDQIFIPLLHSFPFDLLAEPEHFSS